MNDKRKNLPLLMCIIVAVLLLLSIYKLDSAFRKKETKRLQKEADNISEEQLRNIDTEVKDKNISKSASDKDKKSSSSKGSDDIDSNFRNFSYRGDSFIVEQQPADSGIPEQLGKIIADNGGKQKVDDYSWDTSGTLSHLWYAGISDADIQPYIDKHNADTQLEKKLTELQLRTDRNTADRTRTDQEDIPIINIGYPGGWGHDLNELVDQENKILSTYKNQDKYLIVNLYPSVWYDIKTYNAKMTEVWGDKYLYLDTVSSDQAKTPEGRTQIAKQIYDKLKSIGYIKEK